MTEPRWRDALSGGALQFVLGAALPRLAFWPWWPPRMGPRGLVVYVVLNAGYRFVVRQSVIPGLRRWTAVHERVRADLIERLDREPTVEELVEHLAKYRRGG